MSPPQRVHLRTASQVSPRLAGRVRPDRRRHAAEGHPRTYVLHPDEGHGFARPENRRSFFAMAEAFLAEVLGGRFEPIGRDFEGSSITVPTGAQHVPGLSEHLTQGDH
jgi:hypothetical protein